MKTIYSAGGEYKDCIVKYFDINKYDNSDENKILFYGWKSIENTEYKLKYINASEKYFINTVSPCEIINGIDDVLKQEYFTHIFTICPYTSKLLNTFTQAKYIPICFPFQEEYFHKYSNINVSDKTLDVVYYGQIHHPLYNNLLNSISKFKYAFSTISDYNLTPQTKKLVTNYNLSTFNKWDLLSKSKTCVGFNLLFLNDGHIQNLKNFKNINYFNNIEETFATKIIPQMKTRMIEAANTKTLMLIYKDSWNVIENWFKPNEHFLYWETFTELENMLKYITNNYHEFWPIVEQAHKHVKKYSLSELIKKYE